MRTMKQTMKIINRIINFITLTGLPAELDPKKWKDSYGIADLAQRISYMFYENIMASSTRFWVGDPNNCIESMLTSQYYLYRDINLTTRSVNELRQVFAKMRSEIIKIDDAKERNTQVRIGGMSTRMAASNFLKNLIVEYSLRNEVSESSVALQLVDLDLVKISESGSYIPVTFLAGRFMVNFD